MIELKIIISSILVYAIDGRNDFFDVDLLWSREEFVFEVLEEDSLVELETIFFEHVKGSSVLMLSRLLE